MSTIRSFIRREPVLIIAALAALLSCFFVPPDAEYGRYLDLRTLALLYCLMTVVAGLRQAGLFTHLAHMLVSSPIWPTCSASKRAACVRWACCWC